MLFGICSIICMFVFGISVFGHHQQDSSSLAKKNLDSMYIIEVEGKRASDKVLHAEPLYIDLIRDLGARQGEKEWNVGFEFIDNNDYVGYATLVEYEFAPIDRLGFEVELPFSFYYQTNQEESVPSSRLHSIKLATQYSFFVSEEISTSMALGYIHEFELPEFTKYGKSSMLKGNIYNPFFVGAKRWGQNFHTLIYAGPRIEQTFGEDINVRWQINSNIHYMIPGTRNFIGLELNKEFFERNFDMIIRPQMRVGLADNLMVGIVPGIPVSMESRRLSAFLRLIYEPH